MEQTITLGSLLLAVMASGYAYRQYKAWRRDEQSRAAMQRVMNASPRRVWNHWEGR